MSDTSPRLFNAVLYVNEEGFAKGKTLSEIRARTENRMRVDRIQRTDTLFLAKLPSVTLQPGDRLYVKDTAERLKEFEQSLGATLYNVTDGEHPVGDDVPLETEGQQLAEGLHFPPRELMVADGAGVGEKIDLVEEVLPPVGIDIDGHHSPLWAP